MSFIKVIDMITDVIQRFPPAFTGIVLAGGVILIGLAIKRIFF